MTLPTWLLFAVGLLGGTDIVLFHAASHGLRSNPDSWFEQFTHFLRAPTYASLFVLVPNFALHGAWFWVVAGILIFDVSVSVLDFWVEGASRRFLGGLPAGEYVLHMIIGMLFGAFVLSWWQGASGWAARTSQLVYAPAAVPAWLRYVMMAMAGLVLWSGFLDLRAFLRLKKLPPSGSH